MENKNILSDSLKTYSDRRTGVGPSSKQKIQADLSATGKGSFIVRRLAVIVISLKCSLKVREVVG